MTVPGRGASLAVTGWWAGFGAFLLACGFASHLSPPSYFADGGGLGGPDLGGGVLGVVLFLLLAASLVAWLATPPVLLVTGTAQLRRTAGGWVWPALWSAAVIAATGLDGLAAWSQSLSPPAAEVSWPLLGCSLGYLAAGAGLAAILLAAPRRPVLRAAVP